MGGKELTSSRSKGWGKEGMFVKVFKRCIVNGILGMSSTIIINKRLQDMLSTPMQILLYIDAMEEGSLADLIRVSKMSSGTIQKWIPILEKNGLITVREEKTSVGSRKKIVKLTDRGKIIVKKILELNDLSK